MPSMSEMTNLAQLYEESRPRLQAMLERRIDPKLAVRVDAEDVLSEVYLEARRQWPKFRERADLPGYIWLYGIARDCLIEAWRKQNRNCRSPKREVQWPERSSIQLGLGLVQGKAGPVSLAEQGELSKKMQETMGQLQDSDREILWMRHFDELPFADIAAILGSSENTTTVRYVRALRRLKDLWRQSVGSKS